MNELINKLKKEYLGDLESQDNHFKELAENLTWKYSYSER